MLRRRFAFALGSCLAAPALTACGDGRRSADPPPQRWPDLQVTDLDGRAQRLGPHPTRLRVVNVWARWCAPCRRELPSLQRLAAQLDPARFELLTLALDDDRFALREYVADVRLELPVLQRAPQAPGPSPEFRTLPQTFVVAPGGRVAARVVGERAWDADEPRRFLLSMTAEG